MDRSGAGPCPRTLRGRRLIWAAQLESYEPVVAERAERCPLRLGLASALLFYKAEGKTMKLKTSAKAGVVISIIGILVG